MAKSAEANSPSPDTITINRNDLEGVQRMAQTASLEASEISGILSLSSLVLREYHDDETSVGGEMRYGVSLVLELLNKNITSKASADLLENHISNLVPSSA